MPGSDDNKREHSIAEIENWNLDRTVDAPVKLTGLLGRDASQNYERISSASNRLLVSGTFASTTSPLSADSSSVSAKQGDAANLRMSAFSNDAGLMRVSSVGGTNSPLSADSSSVSAKQDDAANLLISAKSDSAGQLRMSSFSNDAGLMRVSSVGGTNSPLSADSSSVSAKQESAGNLRMSALQTDAANLNVSSKSGDAGTMRVSAIGGTAGDNVLVDGDVQTLSARIQRVSAVVSAGDNALLVRATNTDDADDLFVSAKSKDAGTLLISAKQGDGANLQISAKSLDAGTLLVSAKQGDATNLMVSAKSDDAALFRVSAVGGTAGDNTLVDGTIQTLSASLLRVSGVVSAGFNGLVTYAQNRDDAVNLRVSALSKDGGTFLISASGGVLSATMKEGTAFVGSVSANQAGTWAISALAKEGTSFIGNVSAKNTDAANFHVSGKSDSAGQLRVSAFSNDGALLRVSSVQDGAAALNISAKSNDGALLRTSAVQDGAAALNVSAKSDNAHLLRTSAMLFGNTTGGLTVHMSLSVSSSQNVKSSAGAIYGWYAYNYDDVPAYLKLYNVSGAVNVGTDTPIMTIGLPPSAAANIQYNMGLKGFTNGIGIAATSGAPVDNTTAPAASAVGLNLFYI